MVEVPVMSTVPALTPPARVAFPKNLEAPDPERLPTVLAALKVTEPALFRLARVVAGVKIAEPLLLTAIVFEVPIAVVTDSATSFTEIAPLKPVCVPDSVKAPVTLNAPAPASVPAKVPP
jgi:hypothetical protein